MIKLKLVCLSKLLNNKDLSYKTQVLPESTELRIANGVVSYEPVMSKLLNSKDLSLEKRFEDKTYFITRFH